MAENRFKVNHYYAVKYKGKDNGDLIIGKVVSSRRTGQVILTNLLTGKTATKGADVLTVRNKRVSHKQAYELVRIWEDTKDKKLVKKAALAMPEYEGRFAMSQKAKKEKAEKIAAEKQLNIDLEMDTPGLLFAPIPALERIANAMEKIVEYMGNMKLG